MAASWGFLVLSCLAQMLRWAFNKFYAFLKFFGIELIPLTHEKLIEQLTPEERKETLKPDFMDPLLFFLEGINQEPQTTGFQRYVALKRLRFV